MKQETRNLATDSYDVIIAGASFAGLAVANQLKGYRVLLVDRKPVGSGQTSACGTILQVLEYWELLDSVLQDHDSLVLHTANRSIKFASPYPWCTFDYRRMCEILFEHSGADFLQAAVQGYDGERIQTNRGNFSARAFVDATGWRAVLASSVQPNYAGHHSMNFGIETIHPFSNNGNPTGTALHFYYDPDILNGGVGWLFPRGETASVGIGTYRGATRLSHHLDRFAERFAIQSGDIHGTYFPRRLRATTAGNLFVVGDAAGMCIGLTCEGIRPAMFFGEACGRILCRVLADDLTLDDGLANYTAFVDARRRFFQVFSALQALLTRLPTPWIDGIALVVQHDRFRPWVLDKYWGLTRSWDQGGASLQDQRGSN